jgi:hypothetical protein
MRSRPSIHISRSAFRHFTDTAVRSGMVVPICLFLVLAVTGAGSGPAHADKHATRGQPTQVYADPALSCAGLTPCYASIQQAVANAGPAPAEIGIFPATYAESVNLSNMGSALAQSPGDLTLQALDASGQPTDHGVIIDPNASGGPGTGPAMSTGDTEPFPANLTIRGLGFRSPDASGLAAAVAGDVVIEDFIAWQTHSSGVFIQATGAVSATRGAVWLNQTGLGISADQVTVVDIHAQHNVHAGIGLQANSALQASQLVAMLNETGIFLIGCGADVMNIDNLSARNNYSAGINTWLLTQCNPPVEAVTGTINAEAIQSLDNVGPGWSAAAGEVNINSLIASGNAGPGHIAVADSYSLSQAFLSFNESGAIIQAESVWLQAVTADNHDGFDPDSPILGSGLTILSDQAQLVAIQANGNNSSGLVFGGLPESASANLELTNGRFDNNNIGILSLTDSDGVFPSPDVQIDRVEASQNQNFGLVLGNLASAHLSRIEAVDQVAGMLIGVKEALVMEHLEIAGNSIGMMAFLGASANARMRCSNIRGNPNDGLVLQEGESLDARRNYWGDASGPTHPDNPNGIGDTVADSATGQSGSVDYQPFRDEEATVMNCDPTDGIFADRFEQ